MGKGLDVLFRGVSRLCLNSAIKVVYITNNHGGCSHIESAPSLSSCSSSLPTCFLWRSTPDCTMAGTIYCVSQVINENLAGRQLVLSGLAMDVLFNGSDGKIRVEGVAEGK